MNAKVRNFLTHYFLIVVGAVYFLIYMKYKLSFFDYIKENFWYGDIIFGYFNALVGAFMVYSIVTLFEKWLEKFFHSIFSLMNNQTHETIAKEFLIQFLEIFKFYGTIYIFFRFIHLSSKGQVLVDKIAGILLTIIIIFFITALLKIIVEKGLFGNTKSKKSHSIIPFLTRLLSVIIWLIGIIIIISNLGYDISAIIAGAGIGGIAIALAAQKSLTNVFGAINIMINTPFKIGDFVQINSFKGTVRDISLSYVTIIDEHGHQVMIPNETIITTSIENYTQREQRRVEFEIGVSYDTSSDTIKLCIQGIENILKTYVEKGELRDKIRVHFKGFGESSLDIKVLYFSLLNNDLHLFEKQCEKINFEIRDLLESLNINIPFPTQELIVQQKPKQGLKKGIKA